MHSILMQAFYWSACQQPSWWKQVTEKTPLLHQAGFDGIWLPPASKAADQPGYLPNELYNLNSAYGTASELATLITVTHQNSMFVLADVVLNHRVGTYSYVDFTNPVWGLDAVVCDDEYPGTGQPDTGMGFHAGRDIDHTNPAIRRSIIEWLLWLKNTMGFDGWRYDFVRGFTGKYIAEYNAATQPVFSVGEYWEDFNPENSNAHRQHLCGWLDSHNGSARTFDFTTKGVLHHAIQKTNYQKLVDANGKPSGLIGWWPEKAVTFIDNHDTGSDHQGGQKSWPFPMEELLQGYAYILLHPGIPCVYWLHYFGVPGLQAKIDMLIRVRKYYELQANSSVQVLDATATHYAAVIQDRVCVKIGRDGWTPHLSWPLVIQEPNYQVWAKPL